MSRRVGLPRGEGVLYSLSYEYDSKADDGQNVFEPCNLLLRVATNGTNGRMTVGWTKNQSRQKIIYPLSPSDRRLSHGSVAKTRFVKYESRDPHVWCTICVFHLKVKFDSVEFSCTIYTVIATDVHIAFSHTYNIQNNKN